MSTLDFIWKIIHTYLLNCLLMTYSTIYHNLNYNPVNTIIVFWKTLNQLFTSDFRLVNRYYVNIVTLPNTNLLFDIAYYLFILTLMLILCGDIELNPGPLCNFKIAHINSRSLKASSRHSDIDTVLVHYHKFDIIA